ncbi:NAD(P)H-dependent oxidoreductase [Kingella negevensis]|uniref:NAD(P)H-dependent oxidoreductase n=1 Tax=Kingella negevensis TaxID=1522312 RepID=UPI00254AF645|nr:NAD(P)H-dependent oxidoreductase [Kingella negevensis]MDK4679246.1 NAD(P)H-dependent oxidoreductase [Kingella negevensis]MDK4683032.1 NAD(P)H-dependent oxidoreductase [Kingella negevensis]MDK4691232.1 NAD(P)H-dependent oxidoreductase [Kingella negevensis]MDK4693620.1 NAD(P)H-dependent oxidoreductase [Kingella negevensis]MDK4700436.1 NAD(P)H-dependent oxidoreductase [Kingella negevensis]
MSQFFNRDEVLAAYKYRKSCRYYDASKKISNEDFNFILDLGRLSPSSVGSEPWKFVVIQSPELREKIKPFSWGMQATLDTASHIVVILAKKNVTANSELLLESIKRRGVTDPEMVEKTIAKYHDFQVNDMKTAGNERALFDWCSKQTYIALANMMTGAALVGIDSCPIEGFNYDEMNKALAEAGAFDPEEWGVSVAATFGYRSQDIAEKARKSAEEVVVWLK